MHREELKSLATYAISDLHGQYNMFLKLLEKVEFSDKDELYMLGDAIDRGPDGIKILKHVMNAKNMHFLLGNHEFMMLNGVAPDGSATADYGKLPGKDSDLWIFRNGGNKTYFKYKLLKKDERIELLTWLRSCPLSTKVTVNGTTYILTHSFFKEDKIDVPYSEIDYQTAWDIVWQSPFRWDVYMDNKEYTAYEPWIFIIGHVPTCHADEAEGWRPLGIYREDNIIDIDGCCAHYDNNDKYYKGGILLRLDDLKAFTITFDELEKMG